MIGVACIRLGIRAVRIEELGKTVHGASPHVRRRSKPRESTAESSGRPTAHRLFRRAAVLRGRRWTRQGGRGANRYGHATDGDTEVGRSWRVPAARYRIAEVLAAKVPPRTFVSTSLSCARTTTDVTERRRVEASVGSSRRWRWSGPTIAPARGPRAAEPARHRTVSPGAPSRGRFSLAHATTSRAPTNPLGRTQYSASPDLSCARR